MNLQEKIQWLAFSNVLTMETFLTEHVRGHSIMGTYFQASHQLIPELLAGCNCHPHLLGPGLPLSWISVLFFFLVTSAIFTWDKNVKKICYGWFIRNQVFITWLTTPALLALMIEKKKKKTRRRGQGEMAIPEIGSGPVRLRATSSSVNPNVCLSPLLF